MTDTNPSESTAQLDTVLLHQIADALGQGAGASAAAVAEATDIRAQFAGLKAEIEADTSLSAEGKTAEIGKIAERANAAIAQAETADAVAAAAERAVLEDRLLAPPAPIGSAAEKIAAVASYRDAIARAGMTVTPAELLDLQHTALLIGDKVLARATLLLGLQRGDADVVNGWSAANPKLEPDVDRLWSLMYPRARSDSLRLLMANAITFEKVR